MPLAYFLNVSTPACFLNAPTGGSSALTDNLSVKNQRFLPPPLTQGRQGDGSPRQSADWLAMTEQEHRVFTVRADTPRALVLLRFTALVVRPCIFLTPQRRFLFYIDKISSICYTCSCGGSPQQGYYIKSAAVWLDPSERR